MSGSDALARSHSFLNPGTTGVAKRFGYYDDWKNEIFICPYCSWIGKINDMERGYYRDLFDASCPKCSTTLAIISYPGYQSTKEAAQAGNAVAIAELARWETLLTGWHARRARCEREKLVSPDQLPDLDGDALEFLWEIRFGDEDNFELKLGDRVIWRELAWYGSPDRIEEIKKMLAMKYGGRFKKLTVTPYCEVVVYDL